MHAYPSQPQLTYLYMLVLQDYPYYFQSDHKPSLANASSNSNNSRENDLDDNTASPLAIGTPNLYPLSTSHQFLAPLLYSDPLRSNSNHITKLHFPLPQYHMYMAMPTHIAVCLFKYRIPTLEARRFIVLYGNMRGEGDGRLDVGLRRCS